MMKYVIKNEFIKRANYVQEGKFVPKWKYDMQKENLEFHEARANEYRNNINDVTVIIDGHKYKLQ